ncbi:MAG: helix-turn-helix domain-containing protein [Candidatus ainarchaeum sp.]|nr:helix-turn-helix domain-containing protein [Candidatus ainarchaeum sp.]
MRFAISALFFLTLISASFPTIYGADTCRSVVNERFLLDQYEYYEISVNIITEQNQGAYLGNYFSYQIYINNLNNATNSTKFDTFDVTLISPSNRTLNSQQKTINISLGSSDSIFPESKQLGAQASSWDFDEAGIYKLIIELNSSSELDNKSVVFVKFSEDCMSRFSPIDGSFVTLIQPAPVYQKEFVNLLGKWQNANSDSQNNIEDLTWLLFYLTFALLVVGVIQLIKDSKSAILNSIIPGLWAIVLGIFMLISIIIVIYGYARDPMRFTMNLISSLIVMMPMLATGLVSIWLTKKKEKSKFKWTDEHTKEAIELMKRGETYGDIAKKFDCASSTVGRHLRGLHPRNKPA